MNRYRKRSLTFEKKYIFVVWERDIDEYHKFKDIRQTSELMPPQQAWKNFYKLLMAVLKGLLGRVSVKGRRNVWKKNFANVHGTYVEASLQNMRKYIEYEDQDVICKVQIFAGMIYREKQACSYWKSVYLRTFDYVNRLLWLFSTDGSVVFSKPSNGFVLLPGRIERSNGLWVSRYERY